MRVVSFVLNEVTKNEFILEVEGSSKPYEVMIPLGDDGAIINCTCDCPFESFMQASSG